MGTACLPVKELCSHASGVYKSTVHTNVVELNWKSPNKTFKDIFLNKHLQFFVKGGRPPEKSVLLLGNALDHGVIFLVLVPQCHIHNAAQQSRYAFTN
jgi:hypothetical protein